MLHKRGKQRTQLTQEEKVSYPAEDLPPHGVLYLHLWDFPCCRTYTGRYEFNFKRVLEWDKYLILTPLMPKILLQKYSSLTKALFNDIMFIFSTFISNFFTSCIWNCFLIFKTRCPSWCHTLAMGFKESHLGLSLSRIYIFFLIRPVSHLILDLPVCLSLSAAVYVVEPVWSH